MHDPPDERLFPISEPADNAHVVYNARQMLAQMGFSETGQYLVATAVSELSTNIIRYAGTGIITLRSGRSGGRTVFEVIAQDHGPGIADIGRACLETYSTGKGLGLGLSSVKRIMDEFELWSEPGKGTRIVARKWLGSPMGLTDR